MADTTLTDEQMLTGEAPEGDREATERARGALALSHPADATLPARHRYDASQVAVIKGSVAKGLRDIELAWFLEVSARYGLDPLLKEIYAVKFDGESGGVTIFTGRDGLLKAARRSGRFVRMQTHVVREKDAFTKIVDTTEDGEEVLRIRHEQEGMGAAQRGKIVGAYALVWTTDSPHPWYAEATWEEYGERRQRDGGGRETAWTVDSKKGYPEAMMTKVAESICLRKACGLSGLVGEDEIAQRLPDGEPAAMLSGEGATPDVEWPEGQDGERLRDLVNRANELVPGAYRPAKVAMEALNGWEQFEQRLVRFVAARAPEDPLVIMDAEVVEDVPWDAERYETLRLSVAADEEALEDPELPDEDRRATEARIASGHQELTALDAAREREEADGE